MNARSVATLFGIGRVPFAPGTAASLIAAVAAWPVAAYAGPLALGALSLVAALYAIKVSGDYAAQSGMDDPHDCVIDELAGQWLACAFAPLTGPGYVAAFLLFRFFDMVKPWPVSAAERLKGGLGIVADDMAAGLIGGAILMLMQRMGYL